MYVCDLNILNNNKIYNIRKLMLNYIINYKFLLLQNKKQLKNIRCFFLLFKFSITNCVSASELFYYKFLKKIFCLN